MIVLSDFTTDFNYVLLYFDVNTIPKLGLLTVVVKKDTQIKFFSLSKNRIYFRD